MCSWIELAAPYFLKYLLNWMKQEDPIWWHGLLYALGLSACSLIKVYGFRRATFLSAFNGYRTTVLLFRSVMKKVRKLNSSTINIAELGNITSLVTSDKIHLLKTQFFINAIIVTPLVYIAITVVLYYEFGISAFILPIIFIVMMIVQYFASKFNLKVVFLKRAKYYDKMGSAITETVKGIKMIKFNALEEVSLKNIMDFRRETTFLTLVFFFLNVGLQLVTQLIPMISSFLIFWVATRNEPMEVADVYFLVSIVSLVFYTSRMIVVAMNRIAKSRVSLKRLDKFFSLEENENKVQNSIVPKSEIRITNLTSSWIDKKAASRYGYDGDVDALAIKDIDIVFKPGRFYAIVGEVGSGKSSLLNSCIGELQFVKGSVNLNGSVAYCAQSVFLLNATLRENILFGKVYNQDKYINAVVKSGLFEDIKSFDAKDLIEIGERGINLSGGQKQRISLARALYADSDIYLIDDALSALDAEVGKFVFDNIFLGELEGRTRVLVTHAVHLLDQVDEVIVMKDGKIIQKGHFSEVKETKEFLDYVKHQTETDKDKKEEQKQEQGQSSQNNQEKEAGSDKLSQAAGDNGEHLPSLPAIHNNETKQMIILKKHQFEEMITFSDKNQEKLQQQQGKIIQQEKAEKGFANFGIFWSFIKEKGRLIFLIQMACFALWIVMSALMKLWLDVWSNDEYPQYNYPLVASLIIFITVILSLLAGLLAGIGTRKAGNEVYHKLIYAILRRPMSFFDTTPIGSIINRTISDRVSLDFELSYFSQFAYFGAMQLVGVFVLICISNVAMALVLLVIGALFVHHFSKFMKLNLNFRKNTLKTQAPVYSNIVEAANGSMEIRAFGLERKLNKIFLKNSERFATCNLAELFNEQYVDFKVEIIGFSIIATTAFGISLLRIVNLQALVSVRAASLSLSSVMIFSSLMSYNLYCLIMTFLGLTSYSRMKQWIESDNVEDDWRKPGDPDLESWPTEGRIIGKNVVMRYREGLPRVLKGFDFEVQPKEKIGIVGRAGSGKSSLILALMRVVELDKTNKREGDANITLDGVKLGSIGLLSARKAITLIPQDPFLVSGTVRKNIDPFNEYSDKEVIEVMKKTAVYSSILSTVERKSNDLKEITKAVNKNNKKELDGRTSTPAESVIMKQNQEGNKDFTEHDNQLLNQLSIRRNEAGDNAKVLSFLVQGSGSNLSQGQRQLLCIARALIKKPKILLMDEATANIDTKTDNIIQKVITEEFEGATVMTIAHRLNTIMHYDRIFFMEKGKIVERGRPVDLLADSGSKFYELVKEGGEEFFEEMKGLVKH